MSTTQVTGAGTSEAALFGRLLDNDRSEMSAELARYVLTLGFGQEDQTRMEDLALRNQDGSLSTEEQAELMRYVRTGHLLALLQAKAGKSLKKNRTGAR